FPEEVMMNRIVLMVLVAVYLLPVSGNAQVVDEFKPPAGTCCLPSAAQMLARMFPDVIDLKPAAVIILAGTNDIARNTGPETLTMIEENIQAMTELAQVHGIKVILCSVTPVADY